MEWTSDAEALLSKVPFFVRKRVRKKVEEEAKRQGLTTVTKPLVVALQRKFMASMEDEVKGYSVETCFGPSGCPNRAVTWNETATQLENLLAGKDLKKHLKKKGGRFPEIPPRVPRGRGGLPQLLQSTSDLRRGPGGGCETEDYG